MQASSERCDSIDWAFEGTSVLGKINYGCNHAKAKTLSSTLTSCPEVSKIFHCRTLTFNTNNFFRMLSSIMSFPTCSLLLP